MSAPTPHNCTQKKDDILAEKRLRVVLWQKSLLEESQIVYTDLLSELFFIQHDGDYNELHNFKKRPSKQLHEYLEQNPVLSADPKRKISIESSKHQNGCKPAKSANTISPMVWFSAL